MNIFNPIANLKSLSDSAIQGTPSVTALPSATAHGVNAIGSLATTAGSVLPSVNYVQAAIGSLIFRR